MKPRRYKHDDEFTYAMGMTLTVEMLLSIPEHIVKVFISADAEESENLSYLRTLCTSNSVPLEQNDKVFNILSSKGNCFVIGMFRKYDSKMQEGAHIVLVNPSDAGNLGTIMRTALGFSIQDIVLIRPAVDIFDPKVIRAAMGASFHMNFKYFDCFDEYVKTFPLQNLFAFVLNAESSIDEVKFGNSYSLLFGNEATGLPEAISGQCKTVVIPHSSTIDSLNLSVAAGIAMFTAAKQNNRRKKTC